MYIELESGHGDTPPPKSPVTRPKKITFAIGEKSPQTKSPNSMFNFETELLSPARNKLLVELFELGDNQWEEAARWIRYEEDVEGQSHHWGVPHLGLIFFDSISVLLQMVKKAVVLEIDVLDYEGLIGHVVEALKQSNTTPFIVNKITELMHLKQKHVVSKSNLIKSFTSTSLAKQDRLTGNPYSMPCHQFAQHGSAAPLHKSAIREHLGSVAEAAQVYAAELKGAEGNTMVFIRLTNATHFPEIHADDRGSAEGDYPSKFMVLILGPPQTVSFHQLGRCFSTMLSNESFKPFADKATTSQELEEGVKEFLENSAVIPGTKVDNKELVLVDRICEEINIHAKMKKAPSLERRGISAQVSPIGQLVIHEEKKKPGKFFSGCLEDIKTRFPHYRSDFTDGFHFICVKAVSNLFLACITATVTFGGLMGTNTKERMGMAETFISQSLCGIIWSLFAGQPLIIQSPTGPVLIFEKALFDICEILELDFLTVRLYTGIFICLWAIITTACNGHKALSRITGFTEEIFSSLISVIFLYETGKFLRRTLTNHPAVDYDGYFQARQACYNDTELLDNTSIACAKLPQPNTFLWSAILLTLTLILSMVFRKIRDSQWLGRESRKILGDYSVPAALTIVLGLQQILFPDIYVETLEMPKTLGFTNPAKRGHGLLVSFYVDKPFYTFLVSFASSFLVFILIFVETGITEVVLARKERKMVKGAGKSWDILLAGCCTMIASLFGLPWMCSAACQSVAHSDSLTIMQKAAPGERPEAVAVVEQRVTGIALSTAILVFGLLGVYIKFMPMACLFGVFAYLGITSILSLDLFQRILLFGKPAKYHKKCSYVDEVATTRMHMFTLTQILLTVIAFLFKLNQHTAIVFPFVLIIFVFVRSKVLPCYFSQAELAALDEGHDNEPTEPELPLLL